MSTKMQLILSILLFVTSAIVFTELTEKIPSLLMSIETAENTTKEYNKTEYNIHMDNKENSSNDTLAHWYIIFGIIIFIVPILLWMLNILCNIYDKYYYRKIYRDVYTVSYRRNANRNN